MALDILPIQASAVPCKRVFLSSKETCTTCQSHTTPQLMEAIQLLKYHVKQGNSLNFTEGMEKSKEIEELENDQSNIL